PEGKAVSNVHRRTRGDGARPPSAWVEESSSARHNRDLVTSLRCQLVHPKFRPRFDQRRVFAQMAEEFWIRLHPPKSILGKNKMRCSAAPQPLEILDCLLAVVRGAVVNRVVLWK